MQNILALLWLKMQLLTNNVTKASGLFHKYLFSNNHYNILHFACLMIWGSCMDTYNITKPVEWKLTRLSVNISET